MGPLRAPLLVLSLAGQRRLPLQVAFAHDRGHKLEDDFVSAVKATAATVKVPEVRD